MARHFRRGQIQAGGDFAGRHRLRPGVAHDASQRQLVEYQLLEQRVELGAAEELVVILFCPLGHSEAFALDQLDIGDQVGGRLQPCLQFGNRLALARPEGTQAFYLRRQIVHDLGEADALAGRHPFQPQPLGIDADVLEDALGDQAVAQRVVVAFRVVVAVVQVAAADEHPVGLLREGAEDEFQVDPARAHQANHPQMRRVLEAGDAGEVGAAVAAPVAQKTDDDGFELGGSGHA